MRKIIARAKNWILGSLPAFKGRNYRLHVLGQIISSSGTWLQNVVMGWYAWELTKSATLTAIIIALPRCVSAGLTIFGGILSDKFDKRSLLYATSFFGMVQAMVLGYLAINQLKQVEVVIALSFCLGLINAVDGPARHSFLTEIVSYREIRQASSFNSAIGQSSQFVGSILGILLFDSIGIGWTFVLNGFSFMALIFMLWMIRIDKKPKQRKHQDSSLRMFSEGVKYVFSQSRILTCLMLIGSLNFFGFSYRGILPIISEQIFHAGSGYYSGFMACAGAGAFFGSFISSAKSEKAFTIFVVYGSVIIGFALIAFSMAHVLFLGMVLMFVIGFGLTLSASSVRGECQELMSADMRGRVNGFVMMCALGGTGFGGIFTGKLTEMLGCQLALAINGVALIIIALVVFLYEKVRRK